MSKMSGSKLENKLREKQNSCLITHRDEILNDVLGKYKETSGQNWWHLIVDWGDTEYRVIKFEDLIPQLEKAPRFGVLEPISNFEIPLAKSIDKYEMGLTAATNLARQQPSSLIVVTEEDYPIGILYVSSRISIRFSIDIEVEFGINVDLGEDKNFLTLNDDGKIRIDKIKIFHYLVEGYSFEELKIISFLIGINLDDLPGDAKAGKAMELCDYAERHGKLSLLVSELEKDRSGVKF